MNSIWKYSLIIVLLLLNLYWIISTPILPFVDLPFRLAESVIIKFYNDNNYFFSDYYSIPTFIKSNVFHTFFCAAGIFGSPETANKVYYCIYALLLPYSLFLLIKRINGYPAFSLLSILFILNHNVHWGFTGYTMSVPVLFILFAIFYDYFVLGKNNYFYLIALLIFLLLLHYQSALFCLLAFIIFSLVYFKKNTKRFIEVIVTILAIIILLIVTYTPDKDGGSTIDYLIQYYLNNYLVSIPGRFQILFILDNFILFEGIKGILYSLTLTIVITIFSLRSLYKIIINRFFSEYKFLTTLIILTLICYLILPDNINGQNVIYERFSVIFFLLLISFASILNEHKYHKTIFFIISLLSIIHSLIIVDYMNEFREENVAFTESIFPDDCSATMSGIIADKNFRGRNVYAHFPMYFTVWKKGITTGIVDFRFGLIRRKASYERLAHFVEWFNPKFDYNKHYENTDYLICSGIGNLKLDNFIEYKKSGTWILYRNIKYINSP